jgi:hypothetical protein
VRQRESVAHIQRQEIEQIPNALPLLALQLADPAKSVERNLLDGESPAPPPRAERTTSSEDRSPSSSM